MYRTQKKQAKRSTAGEGKNKRISETNETNKRSPFLSLSPHRIIRLHQKSEHPERRKKKRFGFVPCFFLSLQSSRHRLKKRGTKPVRFFCVCACQCSGRTHLIREAARTIANERTKAEAALQHTPAAPSASP